MVPAPSCPDRWDYWQNAPSDEVELMCLLPNSMYVPLSTKWDATLQNVKEELWDRAINYPLFGLLHEMTAYVFQFVNSLAVLEEVDDETKRIRDIKPVFGVLVIIERSVERPGEQLLNTQISHLIGKGLNEFDSLRSSEVKDFRLRMRDLAEENMLKRAKSDPLERLRYRFKPRLADKEKTPVTLQSHLSNNCFLILTMFANTDFSSHSSVPATRKPQEHIEIVLRKPIAHSLPKLGHAYNYVLKVCGREEYLFGDYPLIQFLYIQEMLSTDGVPQVMIVSIDKLPLSMHREISFYGSTLPERTRLPSEHSNTMRMKKIESSWNIDRDYTCTVVSISRPNVEPGKISEVVCQAGIFHGGKPLCESQKTRVATISSQGVAQWNQELTFPIKVHNMPRMARLCFGVYEITKATKGKWRGKDANKEATNKLAWANAPIFDYKDQLRTDGATLSMWTHVADDTQDDLILHPLGTVVDNPNTDSCAELQVKFSNYECKYPIMFPKRDVVIAYSETVEKQSPEVMERLSRDFERLRATAEKDPMYEMHEQEKKDIWAARERFLEEAPELLPKLLSCVEWGERAEVASVLRMLPRWKPFKRVESALELLDYAYADAGVRSFAVKCLESISDDDLLLYLLQLVQALKHESYLMCDLAKFLLSRAYNNMTIGHYLFWHLRSEMHIANVTIRFGLLLEAYCRGSQDHITSLLRQINCLEKLKWLSRAVSEKRDISKAREALKSHLEEGHCKEALEEFVSPLNPSFVCKRIKPDECRVMDSKMRPLLLDFENIDPTGKDIRIILKIGDDLRQDMFTLQILRIMDRLWKSEGCDFRLNPYTCISMEDTVGMIEVVEDAQTVANIQKQSALFNAASTIYRATLLQWLRKQCENQSEAFNKVVHEFRMSCAGYSVATYVLGIADRHPDNIMVKKSGQLFHIDFGHFLGHFKHKYGFRREWQPFVLTHDFIHVINKGQRGSGDNEPIDFKIFKEHCEKAFKILRNHGHLILSLFSMMISTGLPELSSEKDLQFLRETLVMDLPEDKAMEHFRRKFNEAVKNAWTTSFQWAFHNIDKNN